MSYHESNNRIGISVGPATFAASSGLIQLLQSQGFFVEDFEAVGMGGAALELAIRNGQLTGVIDMTLTGLVNELVSDASTNTSLRLTAAAATGTPMVIVPGGCDIVVTKEGPRTITGKEVERVAKDIAQKASASSGPVGIIVPTQSWSETEQLNRDVLRVFVDCLRLWLRPTVRLSTIETNLSSPEFGQRTAEELACLISGGRSSATC